MTRGPETGVVGASEEARPGGSFWGARFLMSEVPLYSSFSAHQSFSKDMHAADGRSLHRGYAVLDSTVT